MTTSSRKQIYFLLVPLVLLISNCVEEFVPETLIFEDILVVESTITNVYKFHEVKLSRTFEFDSVQKFEQNANVSIVDNLGEVMNFQELEPGHYVSTAAFRAEPNKTYQLLITTQNNLRYASKAEPLPDSASELTDIKLSKTTNNQKEEGVEISISSVDPSGGSKYYRFEYEETYKIVPPLWSPNDAIVISVSNPATVGTIPKTQEERVCYNTVPSNAIFQTETNNLTADRITEFPLKFILKKDPVFRERYSILVKQYVQSFEAYSYYKTLSELSSSESLFSENQPGFLNGNINSLSDPSEKVLGYFEVASLSSQRVFASFDDLYPGEGRALYFETCEIVAPLLNLPGGGSFSPLVDAIRSNTLKFIDVNLEPDDKRPGPYLMTQRGCGDCTVYGSNVKPDFWID